MKTDDMRKRAGLLRDGANLKSGDAEFTVEAESIVGHIDASRLRSALYEIGAELIDAVRSLAPNNTEDDHGTPRTPQTEEEEKERRKETEVVGICPACAEEPHGSGQFCKCCGLHYASWQTFARWAKTRVDPATSCEHCGASPWHYDDSAMCERCDGSYGNHGTMVDGTRICPRFFRFKSKGRKHPLCVHCRSEFSLHLSDKRCPHQTDGWAETYWTPQTATA